TATGMTSPYWYYKFVTEKNRKELLILLDLLTVNETSFFRNRPQIDLFKKNILSRLVIKKEHIGEKRLRVWSAGCSTGEEPYTIAMVIMETVPYHWYWDIKIYASDLSLSVLETANKGIYSADKVNATVDDYYVERYFKTFSPPSHNSLPVLTLTTPMRGGDGGERKNGACYKVKEEVRKLVIFDFHNLKNENGLQNLDVILCRNVMIYFDEEEQKRLIEKFYRNLNPGGYLLLGHAESLHGWNTGFEFVYNEKGTAYKKPDRCHS
ncbi:MAG: protein-glutamate O-methyltransferase CheR, partial [Nitrospirota bacterium]